MEKGVAYLLKAEWGGIKNICLSTDKDIEIIQHQVTEAVLGCGGPAVKD